MTFQYSLRFESGERRGEVVSLAAIAANGGSFTIGRKPGNSLQVTDSSVSGRHAELEFADEGVSLRDLNSTNGTLVGGRKVRLTSLEPGDEFVLGAVEFTLLAGADEGVLAPGSVPHGDGAELTLEGDLELEEGGFDLEEPTAPAAAPMPRRATSPAKVAPPKASAPVPAAAPPADGLGQTDIRPVDEALEITAEDLARSAKSSKLGPIVLVGLAALSAGAYWWFGRSSDQEGRPATAAAAPESPAGNLLASSYSFEDADGWLSDPDAPVTFAPVRSAARSGARGIQADLAGGEVALIESEVVRIQGDRRSLQVQGYALGDDAIELRLGLRFYLGSGESESTETQWSSPLALGAEFGEVAFGGAAPPGMDRVQVLIRAESTEPAPVETTDEAAGDGAAEPASLRSVSLDDVALVATSPSGAVELEGMTLTPMARQGGTDQEFLGFALTALDQVLVSNLRVASTEGRPMDSVPMTLVAEADRSSTGLRPQGAGALLLRAEAALAKGGIATIGATGYASHGTTFERTEVTDLFLGEDTRLVRIGFETPVTLTARPSGKGVLFRSSAAGPMVLQVKFTDERIRAEQLGRRAKEERSAGDSGAALATWNELLTEVPVVTRVVDEAIQGQGQVLNQGREELKALAEEVERARFFGLADLFREKLVRAQDLTTRFRGSEVESQAVALIDLIQADLSKLDAGGQRDELQRLQAIETVMKRRGADDLAKRMDAYMTTQMAAPENSSAPQGPETAPRAGDQ